MLATEEKDLSPAVKEEFQWMDTVSDLLDTRFRIPFTNIRFGADFLIGLIPTAGDVFSFGLSATLIVAMARHGVSAGVLLQMIGNLVLDTVVGAIPVVGDLFDLTYKANRRNMRLLQKHYEKGKRGNTKVAVLTVVLVLIGLFILLIWILWQFLSWLNSLIFAG
ncbi:MAG: DUF4112 domain-containing protein [Bacteroidota bacterium]